MRVPKLNQILSEQKIVRYLFLQKHPCFVSCLAHRLIHEIVKLVTHQEKGAT